jgi:hypothetical protein
MKDKIFLNKNSCYNTYLIKTTIVKNNNSNKANYILITDSSIIRIHKKEGKILFIDPSGGPIIQVGEKINRSGCIVTNIEFKKHYGYMVTLEKIKK